MKIISKIMPCTQYFVIPYSVEELNQAVKDDSFIEIIQSAKPLVNTHVIPVEEAEKIMNSLPKKSTVFKMESNDAWFMFLLLKNNIIFHFLGGIIKEEVFAVCLSRKKKCSHRKKLTGK